MISCALFETVKLDISRKALLIKTDFTAKDRKVRVKQNKSD